MPTRPRARCSSPGCRGRAERGAYCGGCFTQRRRRSDQARYQQRERGAVAGWRGFRSSYLLLHPRCECDEHLSLPEWQRPVATDLNHLEGHSRTCPHALDPQYIQALSHACHSRYTAKNQPGGWHRDTGSMRGGGVYRCGVWVQ